MTFIALCAHLALASADVNTTVMAGDATGETSRHFTFEVKLGGLTPLIDRDRALTSPVYSATFGGGAMLLGEGEVDWQFFQAFGSLALGFSGGYAEKYAKAIVAGTTTLASDSTGLHVVPLKLLLVYRFDYLARRFGIPLVPFAKGGGVLSHWWVTKGAAVETVNGQTGVGWAWGLAGGGGLAFQLDILDPRLARDFDTSMGVNHSYLFAEFMFEEVNRFGERTAAGQLKSLDLSSRHFMFGLAFEI